MATPNETPAAPAAPASVAPVAKPLSAAELQREISSPPPVERAPSPAAERAEPKEKLRAPELPSIKEDKASPPRPDFKSALKDKVMKKEEAAPVVETPKPEPKKAVSADDAPPPKAETVTDAVVPDEHKRVLPHDKPDTAKRIKAILAERDAAKQEAAAAKAEYEAAKKAPSTPPEELLALKKEHETAQSELLRLRRLHEIHNDPEFATKYREPVKLAEKSIEDTLKRNGLTDPVLKVIQDEGGFSAFSRSKKTFTVNEPGEDGEMKPVSRTAGELARNWLNSLPVADAEQIRASLGKQSLLQDEEKNAIAQAQAEAKTYFEGQTKAQREAAMQAETARNATLKEYQDWLKSTEESTDWLKDRTLPDNATAEQKADIERHNEFNKQLRDRLRKDPTNAKEYGELKLEAAEAHHLRRVNGDKDARIAELEAQLSRAKGAMRTTPKGGSLLKDGGAPAKKDDVDPSNPTGSFLKGLRKRMQAGEDE
jgi:hypothetical protein